MISATLLTTITSLLPTTIMPSLNLWTLAKTLAFLLLLINIKTLPLTWHFRFYRSLLHHFLLLRRYPPKPTHLFSPLTTTSRASTYECDLNGHKSNSTYFADLDIARTHLVCHLTKRSFALRRARKDPVMYVALAGVTALFRREIPPFRKYTVSSRVLCWDRKWVFVVSHFVGGKKGGKEEVYASALSKYVFKSGRKTVPPVVVLGESGLLPERPGVVERIVREDLDLGRKEEGEGEGYWTWERVEKERKRGLEIAKGMLAMDGLVDEYRDGTEEGLEKIGQFYGSW